MAAFDRICKYLLFLVYLEEACNVKLIAKTGQITSPNYSKDKTYPTNSNCRWVIETDTDYEINLKFEDFKLESHSECRYDYVTIKGSQVCKKHQ